VRPPEVKQSNHGYAAELCLLRSAITTAAQASVHSQQSHGTATSTECAHGAARIAACCDAAPSGVCMHALPRSAF
jgi:hypothetical protein